MCWLGILVQGAAQRTYTPHSVLATGNWYRIGVNKPGIYKLDIPFLNSLGVSTGNLPSSTLRLFGNGGAMLPESNQANYFDDLQENAIMVVDGGDGVINGGDYVLFYSNGHDQWIKDSANQRFQHQKNLYTTQAYYYLTIGGTGKRIPTAALIPGPATIINSFSERIFHELDSVNFLNSGKEWYGEEFSDAPGKSTIRTFNITVPNLPPGSPITLRSSLAGRSINAASRFDVRINNQAVGQVNIAPISGGQFDAFAQQSNVVFSATGIQTPVSINYNYVPGSFNSQGWLNWFELFTRPALSLNGMDQLLFRDWSSVGNNTGEFVIANATQATQVWETTDPLHPISIPGNFSGNEFRFINTCERLREYVTFNATNFLIPLAAGKIVNQDLHNITPVDYIIISHAEWLTQAQRLAAIHQQRNNFRVRVVTPTQVYNEFSSGVADPTAIKDFVKMYFDKYGNDPVNKLKYLLLFGDASFDYKDRVNNNTNYVPAYESNSSLDPLLTYASDDFFGFLNDNEDINNGSIINYLDIGIGRVPAKNSVEAKSFVDKVEAYFNPGSFGPWRNNLTFVADDEDLNLHLNDAEILTTTSTTTNPLFNLQKIYLDAFQQESGSGGSRYPQAEQASNNQVFNGTLIWNYNGHGGARRLAEETILDQEKVDNWNNPNRLPLFITATCDFAPYDNPFVNSIGENILLRPKTGGIALMTTTRVVFAFSNRIMNDNYLRFALQPDANAVYKSLGDAVKEAKNFTYQTSGDFINNRKFTLLGDPALTIAFPKLKIRATRVNGIPVAQADTLSSTEKIIMEGEVTDVQGNLLSDFNGNVYPVVFDKPQVVNTLANDPGSQVVSFTTQTNVLFKGKASVSNGRFVFTFKVPKDINFQFGNGKLSLYAEDGLRDGNGIFTNFIVGGAGNSGDGDNTGPQIKPYLNDDKFVNGGVSNQNPILIVRLSDSSGINTTGTGIGHDIVATLDNDNRRFFILNDFYEGDLDSYRQGIVHFQLPEMSPGSHTLKIKAWDVLNNSNEAILDFTVANDEELVLNHVLNYPNPFSTKTQFWFEHNRPGQPLQVFVQIMTITGRVIKTIRQTIISDGNRSTAIEWDGRDEFGDKPGRGVYLYKIRITTPDNKKKEVIEKLVLF